jgi:ribose transport system substrate-binding protein
VVHKVIYDVNFQRRGQAKTKTTSEGHEREGNAMKTWPKKKIMLGTALVFIVGAVFCLQAYAQSGPIAWKGVKKPQNEWFVGVALPEFSHPFWVSMFEAANDAGKKYGFKVEVRDAERDAQKQAAILQDFIVKKVDCIVVAPEVGPALIPVFNKAEEAKIPVIVLNRCVPEASNVASCVGPDNYLGGLMQGQLIADAVGGKGNIIILQGTLGVLTEIDRTRGVEDQLKAYPDVKVVGKFSCTWDKAKAVTATQNALVKFPKGQLHGIISQDSEMAMGALQAVKAAGRTDLIGKIVAFDFPTYVKQAILDGELYGAVLQDPYQECMIAMDMSWLALSGHKDRIPMPRFATPLPPVKKANAALFPGSW